jgi:hypothetical protein
LLLSLWVHGVLYSGEFLTKTTAAPSQEVVEVQALVSINGGPFLKEEIQEKALKMALSIIVWNGG